MKNEWPDVVSILAGLDQVWHRLRVTTALL